MAMSNPGPNLKPDCLRHVEVVQENESRNPMPEIIPMAPRKCTAVKPEHKAQDLPQPTVSSLPQVLPMAPRKHKALNPKRRAHNLPQPTVYPLDQDIPLAQWRPDVGAQNLFVPRVYLLDQAIPMAPRKPKIAKPIGIAQNHQPLPRVYRNLFPDNSTPVSGTLPSQPQHVTPRNNETVMRRFVKRRLFEEYIYY